MKERHLMPLRPAAELSAAQSFADVSLRENLPCYEHLRIISATAKR